MHVLSKRITWFAAALTAVLATVILAASVASAADPTLVIWADQDRKAAVTQLAEQWAAARGVNVSVVVKDFGSIRDTLGTVAVADAPDVTLAAHDWTGQLAANGLVEPLFLKTATAKQFPGYTRAAFSYGTAVKKLYGVPVAVENIGLVVNTKLAKVPTTFAQLEQEALAFKKAHRAPFGIAVQQGTNGDAYHMFPFLSGLGGYIFGTNKAGNLDPSDIGIANSVFLKNANLIDKWNKERLINSKLDYSTSLNAFLKGQVPFWITGPWNTDTLEKSGLTYKIVQVPKIVYPSVPFLGVQGVMVTKYASAHGVSSLAQDFVTSFMASPSAQAALAAANGRFPANTVAGKQVKNATIAQFGKAGVGGVPMPNIPQMSSVWADLGQAWVRATKGGGAMPAKRSFTGAARAIAAKIG